MSLRVEDLAPGDRVVLNCPSSPIMKKREAQFEGVFIGGDDPLASDDRFAAVMRRSTHAFLKGKRFARFLFSRGDSDGGVAFDIIGAFVVDDDGGLRDENGVRLFIERKMRMGQG